MKLHIIAATLGLGLGLISVSASALTFNVTYDSSVSSAPTGFKTAFRDAINFYQNTFTNPIAININVGWGEVAGTAVTGSTLGSSSINYVNENYSAIKTALQNANPGFVLPSSTNGQIDVSLADAAALHLPTGVSPSYSDGSIGFNSSDQWSFSSTSTAAPNQYSLIGTAEHEISEIMGRYSMLSTQQSIQDLYRYTSKGVLDTTGQSAYFSTNGGVTNINNFNGNASNGDLGDWALGAADSFNYAASTNEALPFSTADLAEMKALGYNVATVPEPETYAMLLAGLALTGFMARHRKAA